MAKPTNTVNRVSFGFARLNDAALDTFTGNVIVKMTDNPGFTTPQVSLADLTEAQNAFKDAINNAIHGGKRATALKNAARENLINLLRKEAAYVHSVAGNDLPLLLSSGFDVASTNRTRVPLPTPVVERIGNPMTTKLGLRLRPVPRAATYEVRISYGSEGWQAIGSFTQARSILIENLTPGTVYNVQARAVGGSTGYSDWSDPVSHMAIPIVTY